MKVYLTSDKVSFSVVLREMGYFDLLIIIKLIIWWAVPGSPLLSLMFYFQTASYAEALRNMQLRWAGCRLQCGFRDRS